MQYFSLQHWILLPPPATPTTAHCFCFGPAASFFLEYYELSSTLRALSSNLGASSFSVISFCFSYCSCGSHGKNTGVVRHSLLQWTTCVRTLHYDPFSWMGLHGMAHSFIELHKPLCHNNAVMHEGKGLILVDPNFHQLCPLKKLTPHFV